MENIFKPVNQPTNQPENSQNYPMHHKPNPLIIISVIFLILLVSAGSFVLGKYFTSFQEQPEITQTIKPNKTVTPSSNINSTANWISYKNEEFKYEVKYSPELTLTEERNDIFLFQSNFLSKQKEFLNGFIITITKNDGLEKALVYWRWRVVGHISDEIDKETNIKVNNINAVRLDFTTIDNKNKCYIIIPKGSFNYVIQSSSNQTNQILSTFRFLDNTQTTGTENWKTYINTAYQYNIKYPPDWTIEVKGDADINTFSAPYLNSPCNYEEGDRCGQIGISIEEYDNTKTLDDYFKITTTEPWPDKIFNKTPIKLDNEEGLKMDWFLNNYFYGSGKDEHGLVLSTIKLIHLDKIYSFSITETGKDRAKITSINDWKNKNLYDQILSTLKFIE